MSRKSRPRRHPRLSFNGGAICHFPNVLVGTRTFGFLIGMIGPESCVFPIPRKLKGQMRSMYRQKSLEYPNVVKNIGLLLQHVLVTRDVPGMNLRIFKNLGS